jgi:hypothetical protein
MADNSLKIIAGYAQVDQDDGATITQDTAHYQSRLQVIRQTGIEPIQLTIDPLSTDWHSQIDPNNFRSGCAPIMALARAQELIAQGHHAVIIGGDDALKTGYQRQERHQLMAVYHDDYSIAQLYDDLAHLFIKQQAIDAKTFIELADSLFQNHTRSHQLAQQQQRAHFPPPAPKWFNQVTSLFRGVDCANPLVDFSGRLLLCSNELAQQLAFEQATVVDVAGVGLGLLDIDEPAELSQIAQYKHLTAAYQQACNQAKLDFGQAVSEQRALMEIYTCYPVVPLAFLLRSGLVSSLEQVPEFLAKHLLTITGGMNLARAPWNNPALNGLIAMYHQLSRSEKDYGLVHGNGGIGYRQGIAILKSRTNH